MKLEKRLDEAERHLNLAKKFLQEGINELETKSGVTLLTQPSTEGNLISVKRETSKVSPNLNHIHNDVKEDLNSS